MLLISSFNYSVVSLVFVSVLRLKGVIKLPSKTSKSSECLLQVFIEPCTIIIIISNIIIVIIIIILS